MTTARRFSAALGLIAFVFVAGFAMWEGNPLEQTLLRALVALVMFAVLGFVTGLIGAAIVNDSADGELKRKVHAEQLRHKRTQEQRVSRERREEEARGGRTAADTDAPAEGAKAS